MGLIWVVVLITRGLTTQACTCGSCLPHWRPRHHGLDVGAHHASVDDTVLFVYCGSHTVTAATAQRHSGTGAKRPIEWQEGA